MSVSRSVLACLGFCVALADAAAEAQTTEAFYQGRTVTLIVGTEAGGGYGIYGRLLARHIGHHIPGEPTIIVQNMPGASGRRAANYMYSEAARDGSVLGMLEQNIPFTQAMGRDNVRFDTRDFNYLGNMSSSVSVVVAWNAAGVHTIADAQSKELIIGATGGTGTTRVFATLMNETVGTKFRIVTGYPGGNDINLAMERGEVGGRASYSWASLKSGKPEWLREKKISILAQIGLEKAADLPDVPLLLDLAKSKSDREVIWLFSSGADLGRVVLTVPKVPQSRVALLRTSFDETMSDPALLAEAKRQDLDISPIDGAAVEKVVDRVISTPPSIIQRAQHFLD